MGKIYQLAKLLQHTIIFWEEFFMWKENQVECIKRFSHWLKEEEKSQATIEKYTRDVCFFYNYLNGRAINKEITIAYKNYLSEHYAPASVNSMLAALNSFLCFLNLEDCRVKNIKIQKQIFTREEKELSKEEYQRLIKAAKGTRISVIIQTICGTGIRVSELQYITVEAVRLGKTIVNCKNKARVIFLPSSLQKLLKEYIKKAGIKAGSVFVSRNGKSLDRSNIWKAMKSLCEKAQVSKSKVFPHNLRHLFARTFYSIDRDIVRLADLLGHSSINTTRIYTMETGSQHINRLELVQSALTT